MRGLRSVSAAAPSLFACRLYRALLLSRPRQSIRPISGLLRGRINDTLEATVTARVLRDEPIAPAAPPPSSFWAAARTPEEEDTERWKRLIVSVVRRATV